MARNLATADRVDRDALEEFVRPRHKGTLVTRRQDGSPQMSPVACGLDDEGRVVVSTYPQRAKAGNARRDPRVSILIHSDDWNGPYVQLDGTAEVSTCPTPSSRWWSTSGASRGEHPDWDEYREAMRTPEQVADPDHRRALGPGRHRRLPARERLEPPQQGLGAGQVREDVGDAALLAEQPGALPGVDVRRVVVLGGLGLRELAGGRVVGGQLVEPVLPAVEVGVAQRPAAVLRGPGEPLGDVEDPAVGRLGLVGREQPLPRGRATSRPRGWSAARCRPRRPPAPAARTAARPRAVPMPPAATTGTSTASSTAWSSGSVPTSSRPWPPPSAPRATTTSTPARPARTASATVPAWTATRMPASRSRSTYGSNAPKLTDTSAGRTSRHRVELGGVALERPGHQPDPYGAPPAAATAACSRTHSGERDAPTPTIPRPPAADTAAASAPSPGPAIGAPTTGTERPNVSVSQVSIIVPLSQTGRTDR